MALRDMLSPRQANVPVTRGPNPILDFQDEMNRLFRNFFGEMPMPMWPAWGKESSWAVTPAVDVSENDKSYTVTVEVPGMDINDLRIIAADGYLTVSGEKKEETEEEKEGYYRQERNYGSFQRVVALPDIANVDKAEASLEK